MRTMDSDRLAKPLAIVWCMSYLGASWEGAVCAPLESAVAEDGRFSSAARTFRTTCASAAGEAVLLPLGRPALATQEELRNELSDLMSGRCETRLHVGRVTHAYV